MAADETGRARHEIRHCSPLPCCCVLSRPSLAVRAGRDSRSAYKGESRALAARPPRAAAWRQGHPGARRSAAAPADVLELADDRVALGLRAVASAGFPAFSAVSIARCSVFSSFMRVSPTSGTSPTTTARGHGATIGVTLGVRPRCARRQAATHCRLRALLRDDPEATCATSSRSLSRRSRYGRSIDVPNENGPLVFDPKWTRVGVSATTGSWD
jgi:hypothetical protein